MMIKINFLEITHFNTHIQCGTIKWNKLFILIITYLLKILKNINFRLPVAVLTSIILKGN